MLKAVMFEEMKELTKKLVAIPSINGSSGEAAIADFIYGYVSGMPYFQRHRQDVFTQALPKDQLGRKNVFALLRGTKGNSKNTLIFHGHMDTVGVEDLGTLKEFAFDCDRLAEEMKKLPQTEEVRRDLESGEYLFGRGASDMKSGDAVFLVLLKHLSAHPEELDGNILFMFNPVEENHHTGMITGLEILKQFHEKEGLQYLFAVNNDYICPLYAGDSKRYIYTGTMGKILPCMYVLGKETHVGQCYEGINAVNLASRIVQAIDLNADLCDAYDGELALPPVALKLRDLKPWYNVQTAREAFAYFSYMIEDGETADILHRLRDLSQHILDDMIACQQEQLRTYSQAAGIPYKPPAFEGKVYLFEELMALAAERELVHIEQNLAELAVRGRENHDDARDIALSVVQELCRQLQLNGPAVVLFIAPPYLPHNTLHRDKPDEALLMKGLERIAGDMSAQTGETFEVLHFFPSLSDSSYLKIDDSPASVAALTHNFPVHEQLFPLPMDMIRQLSIPGINYGCYGKDAHKRTERLYMPYSFGILPELILKTIYTYLA